MQPNLKTFLVIAVLVAVVLFAGLLYYVIYLNSGNHMLAIIFGGGRVGIRRICGSLSVRIGRRQKETHNHRC